MNLQGAVIAFDLDGTLVDTAPDLIGALNTVLGEEGLPPFPVSAARRLVGHGVRSLVEHGFAEAGRPQAGGDLDARVERFSEIYSGRITQESVVYPGVGAALDRLAAAGARLAVCTNKRTDMSIELLDALKLTRHFAAIVGSDLVARKPDPRLLFLAIERAGGSPGRALSVGDSWVDRDTARAAGVPVVGLTWGYAEPPLRAADFDALIDGMDELPPIAERLLDGRLRR